MAGTDGSGKVQLTNRRTFVHTGGTEQAATVTLATLPDGTIDGPAPVSDRIEIDRTGERACYEPGASGDLAPDEGRTTVGRGKTLWHTGHIRDGDVSGRVRNGADAFWNSAALKRIDADSSVFHG